MDGADKAHDAPGLDVIEDVSVDNDTHQGTAIPVAMQGLSSLESPLAAGAPNLGDSMLGKRKATSSPTFALPTGNNKKHKVKDETSGQGSTEFSKSDLFVGLEETATPTGTASHPRDDSLHPIAFLNTSIKALSEELRQLESQHAALPAIPPQPSDGSVSRKVEAYDTAAEKRASSLSIDRPSFESARRIEEKIVDFILKAVKRLDDTFGELHDDEIRVFCRKLKAVVAPQKYTQHARSVGLISDPGAGKSLLITNLLNLPGAAISKSSRKSTTNVRHEYIHAELELRAPVVAVVHPFAESSMNSKIRNQVAKILEFKHYEHRSLGDAFDKNEYDALKLEKAAALEFLASLVVGPGTESRFRQVTSLENYININSEVTEESIVKTLFDCVQAYQLSCTGTTGPVTFEASSVNALQSKDEIRRFAGYTKDLSDPRALWRMVEKISMSVHALVLENGLRLNDVPGIYLDTDRSRNDTGEEAYKACDVITLLKPYQRSSNSQTLMNTFCRCIRDGKDVVLVVTHLDSFDNNDDLADEEEHDEELRRLMDLEEEMAQEAEDNEDYDVEKHSRIARLKYLRRIDIRAQSITREMEGVFSKLQLEWNGCEGAKLRVFPVLNKDHSYYVKGYNNRRLPGDCPKVPIEQTGLVPLRSYLRGIPAEMMLRTLTLSKADLDCLLVAMEMYCVSSKLERKQEIEHYVAEPKEDCALEIEGVISELKTETDAILEKVISDCKLSWRDEGGHLSENWGSKQHNNYLAFCKRQGKHQTAGEKEDWNEAVQNIMFADLVSGFKLVFDMVKHKEAGLLKKVVDMMKNIGTNLRSIMESTMIIFKCLC